MGQLSRRELEDIIERDLPGHELASEDLASVDHVAPPDSDEVGEDIEALRAKFLGRRGSAGGGEPRDSREPANEHDQIVAVRTKRGGERLDHQAPTKSVIVSGREKRVIGTQG